MTYPPKPRPGDRVAILSPSAGTPQVFPDVYELGLRRLRKEIGLVPVEYPTTRVMGSRPEARAEDLHAAFADPSITAVMATIGGDDQITVLRHLDAELLRANPKPFFGYSDNTNLLHHLWTLGVVGFHGGSIMVHLGRGGRTHQAHVDSLRAALFEPGWRELEPPENWGDESGDWHDPSLLASEPPMWPHEGWEWINATGVVEGRSWGGNLEIISWLLQAGFVPSNDAFEDSVLFLETSEEMPPATEVYRILRNMGERGLLAQFPALIVGRPKAWEFDRRNPPDLKRRYVEQQREAVLAAMTQYNPDAAIVLQVDIGHTDPQLIIPYGGGIRVDGQARTISVRY
jgi:muramoyltetrapeptide carboxypeptidase LdcA involved in peptidoglycan recycling